MLKPIILAGGVGSRLWPASRSNNPKQFQNILDDNSMLHSTINRINEFDYERLTIVTNEEYRFYADKDAFKFDKDYEIILEPFGRNTAPAVAITAIKEITEKNNDPILLIMPSDHTIQDVKLFQKTITESMDIAESGKLVVFGVEPKSPNPNYGYIIPSNNKCNSGYCVEKFIEKPKINLAAKLISDNNALFNSGMFMFKASSFLNELKKYNSKMYEICTKVSKNLTRDNKFLRINPQIFEKCPDDSIDYAVMEKTSKGVVIKLESFWSDLGTWESIADIMNRDENNNCLNADVYLKNSKNNFIKSDKFVVGLGIEDTFLIDTHDSILLSKKDHLDKLKDVVRDLKLNNRKEISNNFKDFRPWGWFENIFEDQDYKVKRLCIYKNSRISLQKHFKRSEHWVVVSGIATITKGEDVFELNQGESVYIELGEIHRIENKHSEDCIIVETQIGVCIEEDIERLEDDFNRLES